MRVGFDYVGITTPFYCHDRRGNSLLHKRSKMCRDEQGMWDPGSGQLEFDLTLEQNVLKEVREEYGCGGIIEGGLPAHDILRTIDGKPSHWIAVPFFIAVSRSLVVNNEPEKIDDIGWFRLDALPSPLHSGFQYTLSKFKSKFLQYLNPTARAGI